MKLHTDREMFSNAIQATSQMLGMAPEFVEKDYWICQILQQLSRHPQRERIVWKGGTSLSKAYGLIKRFSSDVDFAVLLEGLSQNQQKKLVARIGKDATADMEELDMPEVTIKNNRFRKTYHGYSSVLNSRKESLNFLGNHVIIEIISTSKTYRPLAALFTKKPRLSKSYEVFSCLILSIQDRNQTKKRPFPTYFRY